MRKQTPWVIAGAVLVLGSSAYLAFGRRGPDASKMTQYKLAEVTRGTVRKTVSSTGVLQPWTVVDIKSKAGGRVDRMLVDVGTRVTKGQVIALIDPSDTKLAVNQAQADRASAIAKKAQSSRTYDLTKQQSAIAILNAQSALASAKDGQRSAEARLATARTQASAQPTLTKASIGQAQASYNQAVKQRALLDATNKQDRASAQSSYDQAVANATNAETNLARQKSLLQKGFVSQQAVDTAQASYDVSRAQVSSVRAKLDTLEAELQANAASADARVAQALASLNSAKAGSIDVQMRRDAVTEAEASVRQARSQVAQAELALNQAKANQANNDIRRLDIASATAAETRSQATLTNAEDTLEQTTVRAPSAGVVLTKYVDQGTIITSGLSLNSTGSSIVQLGDTTRMFADVTVDETDIANVDEGQRVEISMDAYPGVPFEGKVARIDPQAVDVQNVTTIHVRVEVDNSSPTFRLLKPGMNATCEFVVEEKEDVLNVPSSAVTTDDQGSTVQIATGGKPAPADPATGQGVDPTLRLGVTLEKRQVEIGTQGDDTTEITKGLKEGETVVAQTIEPATPTSQANSPFGGRGGPGGGARGGRR